MELNDEGEYIFIDADVSLICTIYAIRDKIEEKVKEVELLFLSQVTNTLEILVIDIFIGGLCICLFGSRHTETSENLQLPRQQRIIPALDLY